jgi:hypothetical protein
MIEYGILERDGESVYWVKGLIQALNAVLANQNKVV